MLKALIFDWHGVLDHTKFESIIELTAQAINQPLAEVRNVSLDLKDALARGYIAQSEVWDRIKHRYSVTDQQLAAVKDYSLRVELNHQLYDALPQLQRHYKLGLLSDCPLDKAQIIHEQVDLSVFDQVMFSCETHLTKGDDEFFLQMQTKLGFPAEQTLYVDDTEKHIATAQRLGFQAHRFENANALLNQLSSG